MCIIRQMLLHVQIHTFHDVCTFSDTNLFFFLSVLDSLEFNDKIISGQLRVE